MIHKFLFEKHALLLATDRVNESHRIWIGMMYGFVGDDLLELGIDVCSRSRFAKCSVSSNGLRGPSCDALDP